MDDFVVRVKQLAQYPLRASAGATDAVLLQEAVGGPYYTTTPLGLLAPLQNARVTVSGIDLVDSLRALNSSGLAVTFGDSSTIVLIRSDGSAFFPGPIEAAEPSSPQHLVNARYVTDHTVWTFNGRQGNVRLRSEDVLEVGAAPIHNAELRGCPTAPLIEDPRTNGAQIANTDFVQRAINFWMGNFLQNLDWTTVGRLAWSAVTEPFRPPAQGRTVDVSVRSTEWMTPRQPLFIDGSTYEVVQVLGPTAVRLKMVGEAEEVDEPTVSINVIGQQTVHVAFSVNGSLRNYTTVPRLEWRIGTGAWTEFVADSDTYWQVGNVVQTTEGPRTFFVRDAEDHDVSASANFNVSTVPVPGITFNPVSPQTVNVAFPISGAVREYQQAPSLAWNLAGDSTWNSVTTVSTSAWSTSVTITSQHTPATIFVHDTANTAVNASQQFNVTLPVVTPGELADYVVHASVYNEIDATFSRNFTVTTTEPNTLIIVWAITDAESTPIPVQTISGGGLSWQQRGPEHVVAVTNGLRCFWAHAPTALTNANITISTPAISAGFTACVILRGLANPANPWDANPSLPAATPNTNTALTGTTTSPRSIMVALIGGATFPSAPTGWQSFSINPGSPWLREALQLRTSAGSVTLPATPRNWLLDAVVLP